MNPGTDRRQGEGSWVRERDGRGWGRRWRRWGWVLGWVLGWGIVMGVRGGDWPQFLGPRGDGTTDEAVLVRSLPKEGLPVVWERAVGTGYSAPSILHGNLVLHHREGDQEVVESMDAATGRTLWKKGAPTGFQDPYGYNNGPRASPVLAGDRVYTFGAEGRLQGWTRSTGELLWERETGKEFEVPEAFFGVGSTPWLEGDRLIVMVGGQPDSGVVAFDPQSGRTVWESVGESNWTGQTMHGWAGEPAVRWQRWEKQASYASPVAVTIHGERHVLCLMRQGLVSLDPDDGRVRFSYWFRARVQESVNAANPVVRGDLILLSAAYQRVGSVLLRVRVDGQGVDEVWRGTSMEAHWSTPLLDGSWLVGFSGRNEPDAMLRVVEWGTGRMVWERSERWAPRSSRTPPVFGRGSLIRAGDRWVALGEGGLLGWWRRTEDGAMEELGRWQVPGLRYPCWTAPVLADGRLYLRSEDRLICLDAGRVRDGAGTAP